MINSLLLVLHVLVCGALILVVLLQSGKGGGLAGAFGGGGGQTGQALFGGRGAATVLTKASSILGMVFLLTSLVLALMASHASGPSSVIRQAQDPGTVTPALDAPSPAEVGMGTSTQDQAQPGDAGTPATPAGGDASPEGNAAGGGQDEKPDTP